MKKEIVCLVTKNGDKNHSIQLWSDNPNKMEEIHKIFWVIHNYKTIKNTAFVHSNYNKALIYKKFSKLHLFLQGYSDTWIMLETLSDKEDLMIEFGEFCAKELNFKFDII